jgi:hypothetical protein
MPEVLAPLIRAGWLRLAPKEAVPKPVGGGRAPNAYVATPWALGHVPTGGEPLGDPGDVAGRAERLLHEALHPVPSQEAV